jgi:hypothetical protein
VSIPGWASAPGRVGLVRFDDRLLRRSFPPRFRPAAAQVGTGPDDPRVAVRAPDSLRVLARMWHGQPEAGRRLTVKERLTVGVWLSPALGLAHGRRAVNHLHHKAGSEILLGST